MSGKKSIWRYHKEAFWEKFNLSGLALVATGVIFGGVYSLPILLIGSGLEILYLYFVPGSKKYQEIVNRRYSKEEMAQFEKQKKQMLTMLTTDQQLRYKRLERMKDRLLNASDEMEAEDYSLVDDEIKKLGEILFSFLNLSVVSQRFKRHLKNIDQKELERNLDRLRKQLESDSSVKRSPQAQKMIKKNIDILEKRIEQIEDMKAKLKAIDAQIETIEDGFGLIHDKLLVMRSTGETSTDLESIISNMETTEEALKETDTFLQELQLLEKKVK